MWTRVITKNSNLALANFRRCRDEITPQPLEISSFYDGPPKKLQVFSKV